VIDRGGVVHSSSSIRVEVWPTSQGDLHFVWLDGTPCADAVEDVFANLAPGTAVVIKDAAARELLLERGAQQVRHVLAMTRAVAPESVASDVPGLVLRSWQDTDAVLLAPALVGAYNAEHPDPTNPDLDVATRTLTAMAEDPANPRLRATTVAELDGRPIGAAFVLRSEHVEGWKGPWIMNVFRAPEPEVRGVGAAMLVHALEVLREDGESSVGLAVTATNPARRVYERLGFAYDYEGWILVLPGGDAPAH
jgi:GNAT superfamily N-acetyltransferase